MRIVHLLSFATCFCVIFGFVGQTYAKPEAVVQQDLRTDISNCYGHPDDAMKLVPLGKADAETTQYFCSARKPVTKIIADKKGHSYVFLDYARRGRSAVDDYLDIFQIAKGELYPVLETRLSCSTRDSAKRSRFSYVAGQSPDGDLELKLTESLETSTSDEVSNDDPYCDQPRAISIGTASAAPQAGKPHQGRNDFRAEVAGADILAGTILPSNAPCDQLQDVMVLRTADGAAAPRFWLFCSSYGGAEATGYVDNANHKYVVLAHGEGHGTGLARTPYLSVYRMEKQGLNELLRITTAWGTGLTEEFDYGYEIDPGAPNGLRIILSGVADDTSRCCVPTEKIRTIWVDREP